MDEIKDKELNPIDATEEVAVEEVHYKEMSPAQMVARRFFRSRLSLIGLIMLIAMFVFAFAGPPVMHALGYAWYETDTDRTPTVKRAGYWIDGVDANGNTVSTYQFIEQEVSINSYAPVSSSHLLGTDEKGMDVFIRLMYGGRISLTLGFVVIILETIIGILLGGVAGYFGGWVDQLVMRIVDIINCIPTMPILLIASAVIDSWNIDPEMRIYYLMRLKLMSMTD